MSASPRFFLRFLHILIGLLYCDCDHMRHPYPLDGGGPGVYVRYIFWCFEPEKMYGTFFLFVTPRFAVHFFRYQKKCTCTFFLSHLKMYNAHFQVQRGKCTCTFYHIFNIIEDFRDFWNKAAPHTPPPPTKDMFYKVLQWWKSGFNNCTL